MKKNSNQNNANENSDPNVLAIRVISFFVIIYLFLSLVSPIFFEEGKVPMKIETPDIILIALLLLFNSGILDRLENLGVSKEKGFMANFFKIGKDEVPTDDLGTVITNRLRELEDNIEAINKQQIKAEVEEIKAQSRSVENEAISPSLNKILQENIYPMLKTNLWIGRYVDTLAKNTSVSEEIILKFCRERDDIELYKKKDKNGERWVALLKERSEDFQKYLQNKKSSNS